MLEPSVISSVALGQLAAWEDIARDWATVEGTDAEFPNVVMVRCASCFGGLYRGTDDTGRPYHYTPEQQLALVVAHLRQAHMDLDPDRG